MTSEKITIYRTSEDKSEAIAQYPTTVSSQVYDEETLKPITQQFEEITTQLAQITAHIHPIQTTAQIQEVLNGGGRILVNDGTYTVAPLYIKDDTVLQLSSNVIFMATSGYTEQQCLLNIENVKNVTIYGNNAQIKMLKGEYLSGEWRHGVVIKSSENVAIYDLHVLDSGGDGFYVGASLLNTTIYSKNIHLVRCTSTNNRRQALSLISCDGFHAEFCDFNNTNGTAPQAGVDIEPNASTDKLKRIRFTDCKAVGNAYAGFLIALQRLDVTSDKVDIVFNRCLSEQNIEGFRITYLGDGTKGDIKLIDCKTRENSRNGLLEYDCHANGVRRLYERVESINDNAQGATSETYGLGCAFFIKTVNVTNGGNSYFKNCNVVDDRDVVKNTRGWASRGTQFENIVLDNCNSKNNTVREYDIQNAKYLTIKNDKQKLLNIPFHSSLNSLGVGQIINNAGATVKINYTLVHSIGNRYTIRNEMSTGLKIIPSGLILGLSVVNTPSIETTQIGAFIIVEARADGNWDIINIFGTWTPVE